VKTVRSSQVRISRYWWHAVIASTLVLVAPPATVMWLESAGVIETTLVSVVAGVAGSMLVASLGAALWMRVADSNDVVFSDLLLWGYLRRLLMEQRIMNSAKLLRSHPYSGTSQIKTLQKLAAALEAADPYTHGHSRRVARISCMIAREMGLPKRRIQLLRVAAAVHDVGKLYVPSHIINKVGKPTQTEFELVKKHSSKGSEMVARSGNGELTSIVRHHHERVDGKGYPDGLAGQRIPLCARIIAVADAFDAMTSNRSYRSAVNHKTALERLRQAAGTQLDPQVVQAFLSYYSGRRSLTRWALVASSPHRWIGDLSGWMQGAAAAGVKGTAAAAGSAALLTGSVLTGSAVAPAVAKQLPNLEGLAKEDGQGVYEKGKAKTGLPPGLAKKDKLPPGLAKKDELPPGLKKRLTGGKHDKSGKHQDKAKSGKPKDKIKPVEPKDKESSETASTTKSASADTVSTGEKSGSSRESEPLPQTADSTASTSKEKPDKTKDKG
jgi:hypothetical protein